MSRSSNFSNRIWVSQKRCWRYKQFLSWNGILRQVYLTQCDSSNEDLYWLAVNLFKYFPDDLFACHLQLLRNINHQRTTNLKCSSISPPAWFSTQILIERSRKPSSSVISRLTFLYAKAMRNSPHNVKKQEMKAEWSERSLLHRWWWFAPCNKKKSCYDVSKA